MRYLRTFSLGLKNIKIVLSAFIIGGFFSVFTPSVNACSCLPPATPKETLENSDAVFEGKVTEININEKIKEVRFEVSKVWKGPEDQKIVVKTAESGSICGYSFDMGQEYLVYAADKDGEFYVGLCGRTNLLTDAEVDLSELGEGTVISKAPEPEQESTSQDSNPIVPMFVIGIAIVTVTITTFVAMKYKK